MDIIRVILTSLFSAGALFIIAKIMGHKQMAQLDFFDYINGITIGSIAAEMATELEEPWKPLLAMVIYGAVSVVLNSFTTKFMKTRKYINGAPTLIMNNGKLYRENMKKAKLDLSEFMVMCRQAGYFDLTEIEAAVFEHNGQISILPKAAYRPICADDMKAPIKDEHIFTEVIMDGVILEENLKRMGLDKTWLDKELKKAGYKSAKEIFLGVCDKNNQLTLFPMG